MKIKSQYSVRNVAGENVVIIQGRYGADMTRIITLNNSALLLWESLVGKEFEVGDAVQVLLENYDVEESIAKRDAQAWIERLVESGLIEA